MMTRHAHAGVSGAAAPDFDDAKQAAARGASKRAGGAQPPAQKLLGMSLEGSVG